MLKTLAVFYIVLAVIWVVTEPKDKPGEPSSVTKKPEITRREFPKKAPYEFPQEYMAVHKKLEPVFNDVSASFEGQRVPVLILSAFVMPSNDESPEALAYLTESAFSYLYDSKDLRVVRRNYNSKAKSRIKAKYILIGRVSPIVDQLRVSVRIENIATGEIIDVFEEYIDRHEIAQFL